MYSIKELTAIILRSAGVLNIETDEGGAEEIARRSRGTPRVANRLLRRVRDFAQVRYAGVIDKATATASLDILEVDKAGLDNLDRNVLFAIMDKFAGGPVGLDTLAISTNEDTDTIEDVCEPYLIQLGYIQRTPRGRIVTELAYEHFGRSAE
jgi:Holliday junction DNA helicase RuvB